MVFILLCGAAGPPESHSFPKPLNLINGRPLVELVLESIPAPEVSVVVNPSLADVDFASQAVHLAKGKTLRVVSLPRSTRGPLETAYLGVLELGLPASEPVVFFDNDTVYKLEAVTFPQGEAAQVARLPCRDLAGTLWAWSQRD